MPTQIKQSSRTRYVRDLGEFSVVSGAIRFTDPCYANDVWCKGSMLAANGKYQAQIGFFRDPYDERSMLEKIDQFKYLLHYHAKFGETYKDHLFSFEKLVNKARDQANWDGKLQSVERLFQLIKEELDVEKQRIYKELADDAVEWYSKCYVSEEYNYWGKQSWLLFEINSTFAHARPSISTRPSKFRTLMLDQHSQHLSEDQIRGKVKKIEADERRDFIANLERKITDLKDAYAAGKPLRTHFLRIKHESVPNFNSIENGKWYFNTDFDVGVDSGQAGFFDELWYERYNGDSNSQDLPAYFNLCTLSSGGNHDRSVKKSMKEGGVFEFGANSYTAHGDGSAPLIYRLNKAGEVIEAAYLYDDVNFEKSEVALNNNKATIEQKVK